jgi:hypothetical protein
MTAAAGAHVLLFIYKLLLITGPAHAPTAINMAGQAFSNGSVMGGTPAQTHG